MSMHLSCPQCRAALKLPEGLAPNRIVACPGCGLKFVPPQPVAAPMPAQSRASLGLLLVALVLGAGGGAFAWNWWISDKSTTTPQAQNVTPSAGAGQANAELVTQSGSKDPEVKPGPMTAPAGQSPAPSKANDELPDTPPPPPKKPAPKTYAETKKPSLEEPVAPPPVVAAQQPAPAVAESPRQKAINEAIDKGVAYLKRTQLANGAWPKMAGFSIVQFNYDVGYASLGGLTLLECLVPADDPAVQKAAAYVRTTPIEDRMHSTYQMACAILFLDRLGDPKDKTLIQSYALHLVAGQTARGGWGYFGPELTSPEMQQLLTFLEATRLPTAELITPLNNDAPGKLDDPLKGPAAKEGTGEGLDATPQKGGNPTAQPKKKNTAKTKPAVPALQSLSRTVASIPVVSQHYFPKGPPPGSPRFPNAPVAANNPLLATMMMGTEDNSNTQFAILALWTARRHGIPTERCLLAAGQRLLSSQNADGGWSYSHSAPLQGGAGIAMGGSTPTMTSVGLLGLAMRQAVAPRANDAKLTDDPAIARGLRKLGDHIDAGSMSNFYLLWSIERVGMLYQLKTIGGRDWYEVGAGMLLSSQQEDGQWSVQSYQGSTTTLDTCFALLFLKRSNLVRDLSERLPFVTSISDPGAGPSR